MRGAELLWTLDAETVELRIHLMEAYRAAKGEDMRVDEMASLKNEGMQLMAKGYT